MKSTGNKESTAKQKELKKSKLINATLIGFMIGIVIWSVVKNTWGLVTLIPLYFIYRLAKKSESP